MNIEEISTIAPIQYLIDRLLKLGYKYELNGYILSITASDTKISIDLQTEFTDKYGLNLLFCIKTLDKFIEDISYKLRTLQSNRPNSHYMDLMIDNFKILGYDAQIKGTNLILMKNNNVGIYDLSIEFKHHFGYQLLLDSTITNFVNYIVLKF